ncbi:MAG: hypothetical protein WC399_02505 [Bacilli bacterium]|jgi:hypothetical protein
MTPCEELEQVLFDEGYKIVSRSITAPFQALAIKQNKHIILNMERIKSHADRYCTLMHEKGHFECDLFYTLNSRQDLMRESERIVDIWTVKHLCPLDLLAYLLFVRKMEPHEIAAELEVNENIVKKAFNLYNDLETWNRVKMTMLREFE